MQKETRKLNSGTWIESKAEAKDLEPKTIENSQIELFSKIQVTTERWEREEAAQPFLAVAMVTSQDLHLGLSPFLPSRSIECGASGRPSSTS